MAVSSDDVMSDRSQRLPDAFELIVGMDVANFETPGVI
jgi:hypothetical protein